ncbi:MAG: transposase [Armatimonadota bacterium]
MVVPGVAHHVTQRGNREADVFLSPADHHAYVEKLGVAAGRHGMDVWAYCLMTNHVHLIAVPQTPLSLAHALRDAHTAYALRLNRQLGTTGHVWQGRFFSCVLDDTHLWTAVRYVERNPVRAGIVARAEDYAWSSAAAHCGLRHDPLLSPHFPPSDVVMDWADWLRNEDEDRSEIVRRQTHTGRPCGPTEFVKALEKLLGRRLRPRKPGPRPMQRQ